MCHLQIRRQILVGALRSGEPLKDSVLAASMGVSRSPVREALRRLEQSGLVAKVANRSYRVVDVNDQDLAELMELRFADEGLAVRMVVSHKPSLDALRSTLIPMQNLPEGDRVAAAEADLAFHTALVALSALPRLSARFAQLSDQIRLVHASVGRPRSLSGEDMWTAHAALVDTLQDAVDSGDATPALTVWEQHIRAAISSGT
jgi:DNA-binding GntR family transcriptional regulator